MYYQIEVFPTPVTNKTYDVRLYAWASDWDNFNDISFKLYSKELVGFSDYDSVDIKMRVGHGRNNLDNVETIQYSFSRDSWINNSYTGTIPYKSSIFDNLYTFDILYYLGTELVKQVGPFHVDLFNLKVVSISCDTTIAITEHGIGTALPPNDEVISVGCSAFGTVLTG